MGNGSGVYEDSKEPSLTGFIDTVQNGLVKLNAHTAELGGSLLHNTVMDGSPAAAEYALQFTYLSLFRLFGTDRVGSNLPLWSDVSTSGQSYGIATGDTQGRFFRGTRNITNFWDAGFDDTGSVYFTGSNFGSIQTIDDRFAVKIDQSRRVLIGGNAFTLQPSAYLTLAPGKVDPGFGPVKFDTVNSQFLNIPEEGVLEGMPDGLYYTSSALIQQRLLFADSDIISNADIQTSLFENGTLRIVGLVDQGIGNPGLFSSIDPTIGLRISDGSVGFGNREFGFLFDNTSTNGYHFRPTSFVFDSSMLIVTANAADGLVFQNLVTKKLAFYGKVAIVQPSGAAQVAVVTTAPTNVAPFGYTTSAQAAALITLVNEIRNTLVNLGLMKGAA